MKMLIHQCRSEICSQRREKIKKQQSIKLIIMAFNLTINSMLIYYIFSLEIISGCWCFVNKDFCLISFCVDCVDFFKLKRVRGILFFRLSVVSDYWTRKQFVHNISVHDGLHSHIVAFFYKKREEIKVKLIFKVC